MSLIEVQRPLLRYLHAGESNPVFAPCQDQSVFSRSVLAKFSILKVARSFFVFRVFIPRGRAQGRGEEVDQAVACRVRRGPSMAPPSVRPSVAGRPYVRPSLRPYVPPSVHVG